ncbi:MAG: nitrogenase-stabilizing/protective protein NifW [Synechococcales bacterium]|nr:nitrogenase-stabilizing/protective protein NifW [Synechococcales bacterium]
MTQTLSAFNQLSTAEEYLDFFGLSYDPAVVSVNRLHILRKFSEFVQELDVPGQDLSEEEILKQYQVALQNAYNLFLTSTSVEQKLFKVFQQPHSNVVTLSDITVEA